MPSAIDPTKPVQGSPTTESVRDNFAAAKSEIEVLQLTAGVGPQGPIGNTGPAGTVDIGTVATGLPGSNATIVAAGTPQARILNFTIPRGDTGAGGGGITEIQAVNAVRQGQIRFEEATVVTAPAVPTTPNIAVTAPVVAAGWALASGGDPITGPWEHTTGTGTLAWPVVITEGDLYRIVLTATVTGGTASYAYGVYFRNSPTNTAGEQQFMMYTYGAPATLVVRARGTFSHLVVVPQTGWQGTFNLSSVVRIVTQNSSSLSIKNQLITTRGRSTYFGSGGKASSATDPITNVSFGENSLGGVTTGNSNTAIGTDSMNISTSASTNVAVGNRSMLSNTTGGSNVAIGDLALGGIITGGNNTALGRAAMIYCASAATANTAVGYYSQLLCRGNENTAVGSHSLYAVGGSSPFGNRNVAVGSNAGRYRGGATQGLAAAADSVFIGHSARAADENQVNQIVIGYNALGHGSNTITLGNDSITHIHANVTTISGISDARVKESVQPASVDDCLNTVKSLKVSKWKWLPISGHEGQETGFMAEDVEKVFPHAVTKSDEWLTVRDSEGKPEMTAVSEIVEPLNETEQRHVEQRVAEKTQEFKGLCRVAMNEAIPTLWGAVQRLIQMNEELREQLQGNNQPSQQPSKQSAPPAPPPAPVYPSQRKGAK